MKIAIVLSILAIGYLVYWNWRRLVERYKPIAARATEDARIDELMASFGRHRKRIEEVKTTYAARLGREADLDPGWQLVTRSADLAVANLINFQFDMAAYFMESAVSFATEALNNPRQPACGTARDGAAGLEEARQCVQGALDRRG